MSAASGVAVGVVSCQGSEGVSSLLPAGNSLESVDLDCSTPSSVPPYAAVLARTISEEAPDPRIQVELERLNTSTDTINKLEVELDEARLVFRQLLADSTQRIDALSKKLGKCVQQARPYYDSRIKAKQALQETQTACLQYERAVSEHTAAREMVYLAEEGLMQSGAAFDHTWQEMLNHASAKVNAAESAKHECGNVHQRASVQYQEAEARVQQLQQQLKRAIARSSLNTRRSLLQMSNIVRMQQLHLLPYFEAKSQVNQQLEWQKQRVRRLEAQVGEAKGTYSAALDALETISDQIHKSRQSKLELGVRGVGVGAESPSPRLPSEHNSSPATDESSASNPSAAVTEGTASDVVPATGNSPHHPAPSSPTLTGQDGSKTLEANQIPSEATAVEEKVIVASSTATLQASCEGVNKSTAEVAPSTECKGPSEQQLCGSGSSSLGGDLSGWQLVGAEASSSSAGGGTGSLALTVEDASMSDSESLASMEMLSDEAIAGLMLEDELSEDGRRRSHAPTVPPRADSTATTAAVDTGVIGSDLLGQLSRSYSEAPLLADRSSCSVLGQSAPSGGLLSSACQHPGAPLSSTNPFISTNPFLSGVTSAPFASSEELLSKIDSVIRSTKPDTDDSLDGNPFTVAKAAAVVQTADADRSTKIASTYKSSVDHRVNSPPRDSKTLLPETAVGSSNVVTTSSTIPISDDKSSVSPSRSPVNRPSSLPLTSKNNPASRGPPAASTSFVPVVTSTSASSRHPEPVVVASDDSSSGSSAGHRSSTSDAEGVTHSSSAVSVGAWSPEFSTPAYAPLHDALESPAMGPPPNYPPPPPPRLLHSDTSSPE